MTGAEWMWIIEEYKELVRQQKKLIEAQNIIIMGANGIAPAGRDLPPQKVCRDKAEPATFGTCTAQCSDCIGRDKAADYLRCGFPSEKAAADAFHIERIKPFIKK